MPEKLEGNILVTGANRGIGLELVKQLAKKTGEGAHIYACCREPEGTRAETLRDLTTQYPGKITIIKLDMSDEDSISAAVQGVSKQIGVGGLNLLINNAAINKPVSPAPLSATGKKDMMEVYEINVVGPFLLSKMFLPLLQRAAERDSPEKDKGDKMSCKRSAIVNISTLISSIEKCPETFPIAQMYPYRTSKAALNMLTRCQAEDFKIHNILVTAIHPGWVRTDMGGEQADIAYLLLLSKLCMERYDNANGAKGTKGTDASNSSGSFDHPGQCTWHAQCDVISQQQRLWDASGLARQHNPLVAVTMSTTPGLPDL